MSPTRLHFGTQYGLVPKNTKLSMIYIFSNVFLHKPAYFENKFVNTHNSFMILCLSVDTNMYVLYDVMIFGLQSFCLNEKYFWTYNITYKYIPQIIRVRLSDQVLEFRLWNTVY